VSDEPAAGGPRSVASALGFALREAGPLRAARVLLRLNQPSGFDCPGCAWPDPERRGLLEFCENGARHAAHEATRRRVDRGFFAEWPLSRLAAQGDDWLEAQGRLVEPMQRRPGSDRYEPIAWDDAFARIGEHLRGLASPDEAVFYTSGRTSNEAAFLWQLFARELGTNNLPDCSNLCHESSGTALKESIGVGKGTVSLADFDEADAIFVIGQNPGSNHPRMFTSLLAAKRRGAKIVSVNPLRERALLRFAHPKEPLGFLGRGSGISDLFLQVRVGGDVALLKGLQKEVLEAERRAPGSVLARAFIDRHTEGFAELERALAGVTWGDVEAGSGVPRAAIRAAADVYCTARKVIVCWCMGLTQHRFAVANVQEIVNLLLLRGQIGMPGAGVCPVRGHSNVQGDRTMGIWTEPTPDFLSRLAGEFGFTPPARPGFDSVAAIAAMAEGRARVFIGLGGNFALATPDHGATHAALARCDLTVQISTSLNRSHLVTGREALILPCLARSERDAQAGGPQFVTVENSMSEVHRSEGRLAPASRALRSEPAIVAGIARAALGARSRVPWEDLCADYDRIRDRIARVIPGCQDMNRRVRQPGGFRLPSGARTRSFDTPSGRARFVPHPIPQLPLARGQLLLMTVRSHDQFNTTVYSQDDRYRGIRGGRRVIFARADEIADAGLAPGQRVDVTSHFEGRTRTLRGFRLVPCELPPRCAAAYFPEANPLVPLESFAEGSRTPTYKSVVVTLAPAAE
jgi:molybdopterin-dependent oxidoreductase alpha subunit